MSEPDGIWGMLESRTPQSPPAARKSDSRAPPQQVTARDTECLFEPLADPDEFIAWDSETFLITPGNLTPQLVCVQFQRCKKDALGQWFRYQPRVIGGDLASIDKGARFIRALIEDTDKILVTHNGPYDYAVLLNYFGWPKSLFRALIKALNAGRLRDTQTRAQLHAIEMGWLEYDPEIQTPAKFSLGDLAIKYTRQHIEGKHGPDIWRLRYGELYGVPVELWDPAAELYARLDPVYTADVFIAEIESSNAPADELFQLRKTWHLYLGSVQGLATDQERVLELEKSILPKIAEGIKKLTEMEIYRESEFSVDKTKVGDLVATILGASTPRTPGGAVSLNEKTIQAAIKKTRDATAALLLENLKHIDWMRQHAPDYVKEKPGSKNMAKLYEIVSDFFEGDPPLTESGRVSTARKVLKQIPLLRPLVDIGEAQKVKTTYLPVFKNPIVNSRVNPLVATGRPSYSKPNIANQPRMKGVRECWVAPEKLITLTENEDK